jgi:RimJ/RimL family protein N-acetyltransferase
VERKSHKQWFYSKLNSTDCEYYILDFNGEPAGSIRFDIDAMNEAKINYLIDPKFTGRGLGTEILKKGITLIKDNRPDIKKVFGYVLESNRASVRIFEKLNFDLIEENGVELKYEKEIR